MPFTRRSLRLANLALALSLILPPPGAFSAALNRPPAPSHSPTQNERPRPLIENEATQPPFTAADPAAATAARAGAERDDPHTALAKRLPLPLKSFRQQGGYALTLHASRQRVAADPQRGPMGGADAILVGVAALDANLQAIPDGTPVSWASDLGAITPISGTVQNGLALARFAGSGVPGTATLAVQIGALQGSTRVSVVARKDAPELINGRDENAERGRLLALLGTAIRRDAAGKPGIDAITHGVVFDAGRVTFTPGRRADRAGRPSFVYQLATIQVGNTPLFPPGRTPAESIQGDTVTYDYGSGVSEWYRSRLEGIEQGFTFTTLPPLTGDLTIAGTYATPLTPELVSHRDGILFRDPATGDEVLRYGHAIARDAAGRRIFGQLELLGAQIVIRIPRAWLAQATLPVTVDPLLGEVTVTQEVDKELGVAYASTGPEHLIAWVHSLDGVRDIYAQRVSVTGTLIGDALIVSNAVLTQTTPRVAFGAAPNEYLVVWQDRRDGVRNQIYGQRVSITGTLAGSAFAVSPINKNQTYADVAYNSTTAEYLVSWQQQNLIYARRVLSDGTPTGSAILVSHVGGSPPGSGVAEFARLAYNPDDQEYLAAWDDTRDGADADVLVQRLSVTGTVIGENTAVMTTTLDEFTPGVTYSAVNREYFVAALSGAFEAIRGQRLSPAVATVGSVLTVTLVDTATIDMEGPAVAAETDGEYLVFWKEKEHASLQRLMPAGSLLGSPVVVDPHGGNGETAIAYNPDENNHLLVWQAVPDSIYARVFEPVDADFTASPLEGNAPLTVTLTNTSQPATAITSYLWDFGDGYTSTITNPVHTYAQPGVYTVTLTASAGPEPDTITKTSYITANNAPATLAAFPSMPVLDSFSDTVITDTWNAVVDENGAVVGFVANGSVLSATQPGELYWLPSALPVSAGGGGPPGAAAAQEAYFTVNNLVSANGPITLTVKAQDMAGYNRLHVRYDPSAGEVSVWSTWTDFDTQVVTTTQHGAAIPVTYAAGDRFGVRALSNGWIEVYKNSALVSQRNILSWPYYGFGGYIGLGLSTGDAVDNFGGGTFGPLSLTPGASKTEIVSNETITAALIARNASIITLTNVLVTHTVPTGLSYAAGSASDGGVYLTSTQTVSWSLGTLGPNVTTTLTYRATVDPVTSTRFITSTGWATATELLDAVTDDLIYSAGVVATDTIAPAGDTLITADNRLTVTIPSGVFTQTTPVTITTFPSQPAITDTTTAPSVLMAQYAIDAGGEFTQPVTLTFDLKGLIALDPVTPTGHYVAIGYLEEFDDNGQPLTNTHWSLLPVTTENITDSVFSVQATHFSQWGAFSVPGEPNGPTKPSPRIPSVDLFSGALTFAYPLAVPPGRGGLQPDLSLIYSSRGADSTGEPQDNPMLGVGWSLNVPQITRHIKTHYDEHLTCGEKYGTWTCWYQLRFEFENVFWLSFNGASHRLIPDPAKNGMYYTESETFLRIRRCDRYANNIGGNICGYGSESSIPNDSKQFWEVTTKDGALYRMGYITESEQIVTMGPYRPFNPKHGDMHLNFDAWAGVLDRQLAYRWRLDLVRDVYGNAIAYKYREEPGSGNWLNAYEASSYLEWVLYRNETPRDKTYETVNDSTWGAKVWLGYIDRDCGLCRSGFATGEADSLSDIQTFVKEGNYPVVRRYAVNITQSGFNGRPASYLASIVEKGLQSGNPWLTTSFGYTALANRSRNGNWDLDPFMNWRMSSLTGPNGLQATVTYGAPIGWFEWRHYPVTRLTLNDGLGNLSIREYAPSGVAWDSDPYISNSPALGFRYNTETVKNAAGVALSKTSHEFDVSHALWGREKVSQALRPSGGLLLQQTINTYTAAPSSPAAGVTFAKLEQTQAGIFDGPQPLTTTTAFVYDAFGNTRAQRQLGGSGTGDDRTTWITYTYNITDYLVDRVATQRLYKGDQPAEPNPAVLVPLAQTLNFYDGATLTNTVPTKGRLTATRAGITNTATVSTAYESTWGNPVVITDARGFRTTIAYDSWGQYPASVTNALTQTLQLSYRPEWGTLDWQIDPNNKTTTYEYDNHGRLTKIIKPGDLSSQPTVQYTYTDNYDYNGAKLFKLHTATREVSGQAGVLESAEFYNGLGQLIQTRGEAPQGANTLVNMQWYDARGLVISQTLPALVTGASVGTFNPNLSGVPGFTRTGYDALGRTIIVTAADNTTATTGYLGYTTIVTDALGHKRQSTVDAFGQLTQVVEYSGTQLYATTVYTYDLRGNLIGVRDALSNTTVITYDDLGRKTAMKDPDMGVWRYRYDAAGNIISQTDALTQTILFGYDKLGRLITKTYQSAIRPTGPVTYTYDLGTNGVGRRTSITDSTGSQVFLYDARGQLITQTRRLNGVAGSYTVGFGYDNLGRPITTTYPDGEVVTTTYTTGGQPFALRSATLGQSYVSSLTYNANGQVTQMNLGNGLNTNYTYDTLNFRLKTIQTGSIQNLAYEYDRIGNVLAITDTATFAPASQVQRFTYDPLDRLVFAQATGGSGGTYTETYTYNPIGNMLSKGGATYQYNDPAHKHAVTHIITNGQTLEQTYDANGNMAQRVELSDTLRITYTHGWDAENRLTVVTNTVSGEVTKFVYDGDGMRVAQIAPDGTTVYIGEIYEEVLPPGTSIGGVSAGGSLPFLGSRWNERLVGGMAGHVGDAVEKLHNPPASKDQAPATQFDLYYNYADQFNTLDGNY